MSENATPKEVKEPKLRSRIEIENEYRGNAIIVGDILAKIELMTGQLEKAQTRLQALLNEKSSPEAPPEPEAKLD